MHFALRVHEEANSEVRYGSFRFSFEDLTYICYVSCQIQCDAFGFGLL